MPIPCVEIRGNVLRAALHEGSRFRTAEFECVLDRDDVGDVVGIEILSFRGQLGVAPPPAAKGSNIKWSYDDEMDAFYMRIRQGPAPRQQTAMGRASFDKGGGLTELEVDL